MFKILNKIIKDNKNKRIVIISHGTAISYLLKCWCSIDISDDKLLYKYKDKEILYGYFNYCETFKLVFNDNNELISIENIK
jgi:broad specificity phosphatase PhoE